MGGGRDQPLDRGGRLQGRISENARRFTETLADAGTGTPIGEDNSPAMGV